jgi:hypothetical protein
MRAGGLAVSSTKTAVDSPQGVPKPGGGARTRSESRALAEALHPAHLRERLRGIRPVAPTFAQELVVARRHATRLSDQNRRVLAEVRRLHKLHGQMSAGKDEDRP